MSPSEFQHERGSLPFAMLAVIVVAGLIVVFVARAMTELRATATEQSFESAIHVAEAGLDGVIDAINRDTNHVTSDDLGVSHTYALTAASESEEREWAIATALNSCDFSITQTDEGETCAIRPVENDGADRDGDGNTVDDPLPWIFAVGFVPDAVEPVRTRVVKVVFDKGFFSPDKAILTSGPLEIGGNLTLAGDAGSIHTNDALDLSGCDWSATGEVTYSGGVSGSSCAGVPTQPSPPESLPRFSAKMVYEGADQERKYAWEARKSWRDNVGTSGYAYGGNLSDRPHETWYDLCSDGTVRVPQFNGGAPAPCADLTVDGHSTVLYDATAQGAPNNYRGWSWKNNSKEWSIGGGSRPIFNGAYYVHHADVRISGELVGEGGNTVNATVIVDAHGDTKFDDAADTTCTNAALDGSESGSIVMGGVGEASLRPFLQDLLFLADRDVSLSGDGSTDVNGFIGAYEQFEAGGEPSISGSVVAQDACDLSASPVHENAASGSFSLLHNGDLNLPLPSVVRITYWSEF